MLRSTGSLHLVVPFLPLLPGHLVILAKAGIQSDRYQAPCSAGSPPSAGATEMVRGSGLLDLHHYPTAGKTDMNDPFNLQRFVDAQSPIFDQVSSELRDGVKRSHWMWFIFPQIKDLGQSQLTRKFAISSREDLEHPILGLRLIECTELVNLIEDRTIEQIFGYPDDLKFRSCMTLFANVSDNQIFVDAPSKYFNGESDPSTLQRLETR
jgi:uncharacterized protein (DUF1810 family)